MRKQTNPREYSLFLLSKRDYSVGKLEKKLREKEFLPEEIETTIRFLLQNKFLDDKRFAEHYIQNQINIKPTGKYKLSMKLKQNFIDDDIIRKVLASITDENELHLAKALARKKYEVFSIKYQGDKNKIKEKIFRHLISRGFGYETVKAIIDNL